MVPPLQPRLSKRCWSVVMKRMLRRRGVGSPVAGSAIVMALAAAATVDSAGREGVQHGLTDQEDGAVEPARAMFVCLFVLGRGDHLHEGGTARVRDESDHVPAVAIGVAEQHMLGTPRPDHFSAPGLHHLDDLVAVLAVGAGAAGLRPVLAALSLGGLVIGPGEVE